MEYIKSCGFVVFKRSHGEIHYLIKQCVYFLGEWVRNDIKCQEIEVSEAKFVTYQEAMELLTFEETKEILKEAHKYITRGIS